MRGIRVPALLLVAALVLTGCSSDPLAESNKAGSGKQYIAGSGVTEVDAGSRGAPIDFSGKTAGGEQVSAADYRGQVLVLNFWWANCGPCRAEAADLQKLSAKYKGEGASFLGVNTRDQAATTKTFDRQFGITYPSILDAGTGGVQLAFQGSLRPDATPVTIVLDQQGRIAARIEGPINDQPSTLDTIISDTIAEGD